MQVAFGQALNAILATAGPGGWLDWMYDFRNMLVHRGRRLVMMQLRGRTPALFAPDGSRVVRLEALHHLPSDPGISDVEVMLSEKPPVLTENAATTLAGLRDTVVGVCDKTCVALLELWRARRANPQVLAQPRKQWPDGPALTAARFEGYHPGSLTYQPRVYYSHIATGRRMRAAALDDDQRQRWVLFD